MNDPQKRPPAVQLMRNLGMEPDPWQLEVLDGDVVRTHLSKAATSATASFRVSGGTGGARLGLVTALRASSQLIFDLIPGETAECIGVVETKGSYREFQEAGRSLHLFTLRPR